MKPKKLDVICSGCGKKIKPNEVEKFVPWPWPGITGLYMLHHDGKICDASGKNIGGSMIVKQDKDGVWRKPDFKKFTRTQ